MSNYEQLKKKLESCRNRWKFIHIVKTGGSSLREAIEPTSLTNPTRQSRRRWPGHETFKRSYERGVFTWSVVRNPYDRFVSSYFFNIQYDDMLYDNGEEICEGIAWIRENCPDFDTFAKTIGEWHPLLHDRNKICWKCQKDCLVFKDKQVDYIVRFENLAEEWKTIKRLFGCVKEELGHVRKTNRKPWEEYYTPETLKIVSDHYQKDFKFLGYSIVS